MKEPRILFFDIESTGLNATFGTILCIGYKWAHSPKVYCPTILDHSNGNLLDDKGLVNDFAKVYATADLSVGHYASRFDRPMIDAKLLRYGLQPLAPVRLIDTWRIARDTFKFHNNRLNTIQGFLGLPHAKTSIDFDSWLQAAHGNKKALKEVVHHCKMDVLVLEEAFQRMRPWMRNEPSRRLFVDDAAGCPSCGKEDKQQHRGWQVTKTRRYPRINCGHCGRWYRETKADEYTKLEVA